MENEATEATVRAFYDAFNRRDFAALDRLVSADALVEETPDFNPNAGTYRGREDVRRYLEGWFKFWEDVRVDVLAVVRTRNRLRGHGTGDGLGSGEQPRGHRRLGTRDRGA